MDEEEDKISKKSPKRNEDFHSTNRRTRDLQQLILLHKRFEEDALRFFRRGYVSPPRNSTENKPEETRLNFARDLSRRMMLGYFPRVDYGNDDDYMMELLGNYEGGKLDKNHGFKSERLALKLPRMETISAENKAIFYTTLPKIPSFPAKTENKRNRGIHSFRNRNVPKSRSSRSKDESFFKIKPASLSWKGESFFEDLNAIGKVRESNCKRGSQIQVVLPKVSAKKDANRKEVDEKRGLPNQTEHRLTLEGDSGVKNISKKTELLEEKTKEKLLRKGDGKNDKTVQFCELLHEVHLYSPSMPSR